MGLISVPGVADGTAIDAADINDPVNIIVNEVNGLLDTNNLADDAVTTSDISDSAVTNIKLASDSVTTAKVADEAITHPKINYASLPFGQMTYATTGSGGGQIIAVTTDTNLYFEDFATNDNTVITKQSNGVMKVSEAGWYMVNLNIAKVDVTSQLIARILWSADNSTYYQITHWSNQTASTQNNRSIPSITAFKYLDANSYVKCRGYTYTQCRIGADSANGDTETSFNVLRVA